MFLITINKDTWESMPEEAKKIFLEVGKEYTAVESKAASEKGVKSVKIMEEAGVSGSQSKQRREGEVG